MTTIEDLQTLYDQGNHTECLEAIQLFLLFNPKSLDALLLKAKCEYQQAYDNMEDDSNELYTIAYNSFEAVLALQPKQEEAMLFSVYINVFFIHINLHEAIVYCNLLELSDDQNVRTKAISYRQQAHYAVGDIEHALEDLDAMIALSKELYQNNRSVMDQELSILYLKKANLYHNELNAPEKALQTYQEGIDYPHRDAFTYLSIANLAFDHHQDELGGNAALQAFLNGEDDALNEMIALYERLTTMSHEGRESKPMIHGMFIAMRRFSEALSTDTVEILSLARHYIRIYPEWYIPYHFAGTALYYAASYEEAFPYFAKSLELDGMAIGLQRYIETHYRLKGTLPELDNWPDDLPSEYYSAGVNFYYETEQHIRTSQNSKNLLLIRTKLYETAYKGFYDYFYNNIGKSQANELHTFAMCCNNYGIALSELGQYQQAVDVHKLGYALSPFWEQLSSWGSALIKLNHHAEAIDVFNRAITYGNEDLDFSSYLDMRGNILQATYNIGLHDEAKTLLTDIEEEYNDFIKNNQNELTEQELFGLTEIYITVQNIRFDLLRELTVEEATKAWQEQLDRNPDDNSSWFMLMQNYYQMKDYAQCIACADNYQSVKKDAIVDESASKMYYMRGVSHMMLGDYAKAIQNLDKLLEIFEKGYEADENSYCSTYLHLANCYFMQQQWETALQYGLDAITIYRRNNWRMDDDLYKVMMQYADGCHALGEKQVALETVNQILKEKPGDPEALQKKKAWKPASGLFFFFRKR